MSSGPRLFLWGTSPGAQPVRELVEALDGTLAGCGSASPAQSAALADALGGLNREDDLRIALQRDDFEILLLSGTEPIDAELRRAIHESGIRTFTTFPRPSAFGELVERSEQALGRYVPLFTASPGMCDAFATFEEGGYPFQLHLAVRYDPMELSLFSCLYDGFDTVSRLVGTIEHVDASLCGEDAHVGESPASLCGSMTLNLRGQHHRAVSIALTAHKGPWFRGATASTTGSVLRITNEQCEIVTESTTPAVHHAHNDDSRADQCSVASLAAKQIRRSMDHIEIVQPAPSHGVLLALCEAARVSCRTGESVSAMRFIEMVE